MRMRLTRPRRGDAAAAAMLVFALMGLSACSAGGHDRGPSANKSAASSSPPHSASPSSAPRATGDTTTFFQALAFIWPDVLAKHSRADVMKGAQEICTAWRTKKYPPAGQSLPYHLNGFTLDESISITTVALSNVCPDQERSYLTWIQRGKRKH
jgi:hypothetical protein